MVDPATQKQIDRLEAMLREQLELHRQLHGVLQRKRAALREAKRAELDDCCRAENGFVQKISELEKKRLTLVGELTLKVSLQAREPMRLDELAGHLPEPSRGRLLVLRQQLRDLMQQVRADAHVVRRATEALARHMQGLMQSVAAAINGSGSYGATGATPAAAMKLSTFSATA